MDPILRMLEHQKLTMERAIEVRTAAYMTPGAKLPVDPILYMQWKVCHNIVVSISSRPKNPPVVGDDELDEQTMEVDEPENVESVEAPRPMLDFCCMFQRCLQEQELQPCVIMPASAYARFVSKGADTTILLVEHPTNALIMHFQAAHLNPEFWQCVSAYIHGAWQLGFVESQSIRTDGLFRTCEHGAAPKPCVLNHTSAHARELASQNEVVSGQKMLIIDRLTNGFVYNKVDDWVYVSGFIDGGWQHGYVEANAVNNGLLATFCAVCSPSSGVRSR